MNWLKEWDKCVFKRANPVKKRRFNEEEENPYVSLSANEIRLELIVRSDYLGRPKDRVSWFIQ